MSKVNVPFAILSLATSILLWASVYNDKNDKPKQMPANASVTLKGLEESKFVVTQSEEYVPLTLSGYAKDLRSINQQGITAIVDLKSPKVGDNTYPVLIFPASVRDLISNSALTTRIKIDKLVTKKVDVIPITSGSLKPGTQQDSIDIFPNKIYITGPAEQVDKVSAVNVLVNLASVNQSPQELELEPKAVDANQRSVPNVLMTDTEEHPPYQLNQVENAIRIKTTVSYSTTPVVPAKK